MFFEDFLKDIHRNIIEEAKKKRKPHPSRLRGRGVEVSKTLFYFYTILIICSVFVCEISPLCVWQKEWKGKSGFSNPGPEGGE